MRLSDAKNGSVQLLEWLWRMTTVLLLPILIWVVLSLQQIDRRITAIEASRFTASHGQEVWRALEQRVTRQELRDDLIEIRRRLADIDNKLGE